MYDFEANAERALAHAAHSYHTASEAQRAAARHSLRVAAINYAAAILAQRAMTGGES